MSFSIIIPAKNESIGLSNLLPKLQNLYQDSEIIVVDDGSTDGTIEIAKKLNVKVISHPYSKGNGAAIKTGIRNASYGVIVCMDGDGQHNPEDINRLIEKLGEGYQMVVGARGKCGQANMQRSLGNSFYNWFASWMVGHPVKDLTSGFRVIRKNEFLEFISLLPNKFSYPTTITMSFFRAGYSVSYIPIDVAKRCEGTKSHINFIRDGIRFLLIIFKIGTLFSPLKLFLPISLSFFVSGLMYYFYTYFSGGRFTNMSALLLSTSVIIFLMGLISEQITSLVYKSDKS